MHRKLPIFSISKAFSIEKDFAATCDFLLWAVPCRPPVPHLVALWKGGKEGAWMGWKGRGDRGEGLVGSAMKKFDTNGFLP